MAILMGALALLTLLSAALYKAYHQVPLRELKRRARANDPMATALFKAATYGLSLDVVLWLIIGASAAGFTIVMTDLLPDWLAFFGAISLIWVTFAWLPRTQARKISFHLAKWAAPVLGWLARQLHPVTIRLEGFVRRHRAVSVHTGLYEKDDLLDLIQSQKKAAHNRIELTELTMATRALKFGDKLVRDCMTPRQKVRFVDQNDTIGPVLMGELHDSGFTRFPVTADKKHEQVVGTLYLHDLVDKNVSGKVQGYMSKHVYYVSEQQTLWHALNAFLKTNHHLFVVINNFEEITGIINIEDILRQILGKTMAGEFDSYEDPKAVAAFEDKMPDEQTEEKMVE